MSGERLFIDEAELDNAVQHLIVALLKGTRDEFGLRVHPDGCTDNDDKCRRVLLKAIDEITGAFYEIGRRR